MEIKIRPCLAEECSQVLKLWEAADATPSRTDNIQELRRLVDENHDLFLVAELAGKLIGSVIGGWDGWRGNIYRLAVDPQYKRHGVATDLVEEIDRRLASKGAKRITALVEHEHIDAVGFWDGLRKSDWELDSRIVRYVKTTH
jgi:ribosomal protein S18 acetylase RimI-like enzyme